MRVLDERLAWSDSLGDSWVGDALRRIVTQPEIADSDIADLAELCKKPHGLSAGRPLSVPLAGTDLPPGQEKGPVYPSTGFWKMLGTILPDFEERRAPLRVRV